MPLLEVVQTRQISASIRLAEATATQLNQYAQFIRASADEVIEEALKHVFGRDREFQEFLKSPDAQRIEPTLRIRKPPANEAAEKPARKPVSSASSLVQPPSSVPGSKA